MTMVDKMHAAVLRVFLNYSLNIQVLLEYQATEDRVKAAQKTSLYQDGSSQYICILFLVPQKVKRGI